MNGYRVHEIRPMGERGSRIVWYHGEWSVAGALHVCRSGYVLLESLEPVRLTRFAYAHTTDGRALYAVIPTREPVADELAVCAACGRPKRGHDEPPAAMLDELRQLIEAALGAPLPPSPACPGFVDLGAPGDHHAASRHVLGLRLQEAPPATHRVVTFRGAPCGHIHGDHHQAAQDALDHPALAHVRPEDAAIYAAVHVHALHVHAHHARHPRL